MKNNHVLLALSVIVGLSLGAYAPSNLGYLLFNLLRGIR